MKPDPSFFQMPKEFWANVRLISEAVGYTIRNQNSIKVPELSEVVDAYRLKGLNPDRLVDLNEKATEFGKKLIDYFEYRARVLNTVVQENLMDAEEAKIEFDKLYKEINPPEYLIPMNKQKGEKKQAAFLTSIVNMIIFKELAGVDFDHDPRNLTLVTKNSFPIRTLARRVDGCYPGIIDPKVIWEIKEYYYTTTFGSRVADGVYESLLDGMELEELEENEHLKVEHYLIVDSKYTWWVCGRSYLCRLIDMLNMGYVDVILFGKEVIDELPKLVKNW